MAVYNDYPYSNMHEINLDWIIEKVVNAEQEINEAIEKINQALDKFQELSDKVDGMEDQVNQAVIDSRSALEKANDALSSLQSTREEIAVLARLVSMTSDRADQAIITANSAEEKANQVMEGLRDVVEVQIPIISRVASNAMDTATQAGAKADEAKATAYQANSRADEAHAKATQAETKADEAKATATQANTKADEAKATATQADAKADEAKATATQANTKADEAKASATQADAKADEAKASATQADAKIGDIENLTTEDKSDIVSAINEINDKPTYEMPTYVLNESVQIAKYTEDGETYYPVMQKIVDLGQLPNSGSKTVAHGINKSDVLRFLEIKGTASQSNLSNTLPLPCSTTGSESVNNNIYVAVGSNNITIATGRDRSGFTGQLVITYVASEPIP